MNFYNFLMKNQERDDKMGRFAKKVLGDCNYPSDKPYIEQLKYLEETDSSIKTLQAFTDTYKVYLDKK